MTKASPFQQRLSAMWQMFSASVLRTAHQAGWPALIGGALLIASLGLALSVTAPLREQIATIEQQRHQLRTTSRTKAVQPVSPQAQLHDFYAAFPARSSLPEALMQLHRLANHNGLHDTRADYRDAPETGTPLVRVRIDIPVTGSYASIRGWIAELLKTLPSLTLDGLELRRADIAKPQLDARVRFQLLLRSAP